MDMFFEGYIFNHLKTTVVEISFLLKYLKLIKNFYFYVSYYIFIIIIHESYKPTPSNRPPIHLLIKKIKIT